MNIFCLDKIKFQVQVQGIAEMLLKLALKINQSISRLQYTYMFIFTSASPKNTSSPSTTPAVRSSSLVWSEDTRSI